MTGALAGRMVGGKTCLSREQGARSLQVSTSKGHHHHRRREPFSFSSESRITQLGWCPADPVLDALSCGSRAGGCSAGRGFCGKDHVVWSRHHGSRMREEMRAVFGKLGQVQCKNPLGLASRDAAGVPNVQFTRVVREHRMHALIGPTPRCTEKRYIDGTSIRVLEERVRNSIPRPSNAEAQA